MTDMNILDLFLKASLLVKLIMLILIGFSIASWAIIIQRTRILNAAAREAEAFEDKFYPESNYRVCTRKARGDAIVCRARNKSFIAGSKSLSGSIAPTAMRRRQW